MQVFVPGCPADNVANEQDLTSSAPVLKLPEIPANESLSQGQVLEGRFRFMSSKSPSPPQNDSKPKPCKHLRVQIVSRDEDAEFVECKECGEVFESSEFKDMKIEDGSQEDGTLEDS